MNAYPSKANLRMSQEIQRQIESDRVSHADFKQLRGIVHQRNALYEALIMAEEALTNFYGGEADDSPVMKHIRNTLKDAGTE